MYEISNIIYGGRSLMVGRKFVALYVRPKFEAPEIFTQSNFIDFCTDPYNHTYLAPDSVGVEYTWHVDGVLQPDTDFELNVLWPDTTMDHTITVYGTDTLGCESELNAITIRTNTCYRLYVPNSFTPNNDGFNDVFKSHQTAKDISQHLFACHHPLQPQDIIVEAS